jgi:hypothetical protein
VGVSAGLSVLRRAGTGESARVLLSDSRITEDDAGVAAGTTASGFAGADGADLLLPGFPSSAGSTGAAAVTGFGGNLTVVPGVTAVAILTCHMV